MNKYIKRFADHTLELYLSHFGAVSIEGPKWCGKTTTAGMHCKSECEINNPEHNFQNKNLALLDPSLILKGSQPRLIDEWQEVPEIWDAVRYAIDHQDNKKGLYILTGSSVPNKKGIMHSGAGRIARLKMEPMSLFESGDSSGSVSMTDLFNSKPITASTPCSSLEKLTSLIIRGGWPDAVIAPKKDITLLPKEYMKAVIEDDSLRSGVEIRDKTKFRRLLESLARNESTTVRNSKIAEDIFSVDSVSIDADTIARYCQILSNMYLLEDQQPFVFSKRSSLRMKQAPKRHFVDPSLPCALLALSPSLLMDDLQTCGFFFEALVERDLRIYAHYLGGELYHYQDYQNREIDAVVTLEDGRWGAFEIKLGSKMEDTAAEALLKIKDSIIKAGGNPPSLLCVITGVSNVAYRRKDGVYSVPITALRP